MEEKEESVQHLMFLTAHSYLARCFGQATSHGIHPGQIPMLKLLQREDGISQRSISKRLGIQPPTVTVSLKRMEKMELIRREPDEKDQRVLRVYLTEKGRTVITDVQKTLKKNEEKMLTGLTESEICLLIRFLRQMRENLQQMPVQGETEKQNREEMAGCLGCSRN